jgi:penicillin-binding protein 2
VDYRERWELKEYQIEQRLGRRVTLFGVILLVLVLAYVLSFWYLQVVRGEEYSKLAEGNRLRRVAILPTRGVIYDRDGKVIASTRPAMDLVLPRENLENPGPLLRRLENTLNLQEGVLQERLDSMQHRPDFEPLLLKEDVELDELARIHAQQEDFPSVEVRQAARRTYPAKAVVAHVLGYVGEVSERQLTSQPPGGDLQSGDTVGKTGVERAYDSRLRGRRGWQFVKVNNLGRQLGEEGRTQDPEKGEDLRLTIDLKLQKALIDAMKDEAGAGVFMDPNSGAVLAMVSKPSYDPDSFASGITPEAWDAIVRDERRPLHDRTIASFYAPGSTFKIIMAVAGLETGRISPSTSVYCTGSTTLYGRPFRCWKRGGHGWVNLHKALVHSCNVYFYQLGTKLGIDTIHAYGDRFGLGRLTGIDLPGEAAGVLPSQRWKREVQGQPWFPGETISVAIGQGLLAVTPIQMATMVSGVATGGSLPRPHVCLDAERDPLEIGVRPQTLQAIRGALEEVVRSGTGRPARLDDVTVAGKTGTAQLLKKSAGIDSDLLPKEERDHAWFIGYAPADNPEIAFAVVVEHGGHGGASAGPVVRAVLEEFFSGNRVEDEDPAGSLRAGVNPPFEVRRVGSSSSR